MFHFFDISSNTVYLISARRQQFDISSVIFNKSAPLRFVYKTTNYGRFHTMTGELGGYGFRFGRCDHESS